MIKAFFIFILLFISYTSQAGATLATVSKIRGKATVLAPGQLVTRAVELGTSVAVDSSIVTYKNSFLRIKFSDGSTVSMGPNSKLILTTMSNNGPGVITLLTGQLRSKIIGNKKSAGNHKFLVRTKSAALGVRGTEFQTIYNPENNITNLLTYEGEVSISKGDHKAISGHSYNQRVSALSSTKLSYSQRTRLKAKLADIMESSLKSNKAVVVKAGQFSSSIGGVDRATLPVNISPTQLESPYLNTELVENTKSRKISRSVERTKNPILNIVPQEAAKEGLYDRAKSMYAQKSGGYIDIKTGLYIPPGDNAEYSQKERVYLASNVGGFDEQTGQYFAPVGLSLNARRGFLPQAAKTKKDQDRNIAQALKLNKMIDRDLVIRDYENDINKKYYSQLELFTKESIAIRVSALSSTIDHSNSPTTSNRKMKQDGKGISLIWNHSSGGRWQPVSNIHYKNVRYSNQELGIFSQGSSSLFGMDIGLRRYISERLNFNGMLKLKQNFYTASTSSSKYILQKSTFTNLEVGGQYFIIKSSRYDVDISASLAYIPSKSARNVEIDSTTHLSFSSGFRYWLGRRSWVRLGLDSQSTSYEISSPSYKATNDNSTFGIGLEFGFVL